MGLRRWSWDFGGGGGGGGGGGCWGGGGGWRGVEEGGGRFVLGADCLLYAGGIGVRGGGVVCFKPVSDAVGE